MQSNGSGNQQRGTATIVLACAALCTCGLGLYFLAAPLRAPARIVIQTGATPPAPLTAPAPGFQQPEPPNLLPATTPPSSAGQSQLAPPTPSATVPPGTIQYPQPSLGTATAPIPQSTEAATLPPAPLPRPVAQQCLAQTHTGQQCRRMTTDPSGVCVQHRRAGYPPAGSAAPAPAQPTPVPYGAAGLLNGSSTPVVTPNSPSDVWPRTGSTPVPSQQMYPNATPVQGAATPTVGGSSVQCGGTTAAGARCRRMTTDPSGFCYQHQPR
jgi:hypothetical protein